MVREFIEIEAKDDLDALIERLVEVKRSLPADARPERVSLRGDDVFGRHILVTYLRPERPEELAAPVRAREFAAAWRRSQGIETEDSPDQRPSKCLRAKTASAPCG